MIVFCRASFVIGRCRLAVILGNQREHCRALCRALCRGLCRGLYRELCRGLYRELCWGLYRGLCRGLCRVNYPVCASSAKGSAHRLPYSPNTSGYVFLAQSGHRPWLTTASEWSMRYCSKKLQYPLSSRIFLHDEQIGIKPRRVFIFASAS